jgi:hypothetical protein
MTVENVMGGSKERDGAAAMSGMLVPVPVRALVGVCVSVPEVDDGRLGEIGAHSSFLRLSFIERRIGSPGSGRKGY